MKNINKRLLAYLTAGVILLSGSSAFAKGNNEDAKNETNVTVTTEEAEFNMLTLDEFKEVVKEAKTELEGKLAAATDAKDNGNFMKSLRCEVYDANIDYIEDETPFVEAGYAYGPDAQNGRLQNMVEADSILRAIQDYNQSVIQNLIDIFELKKLDFSNYDKKLFSKYIDKVIKNKNYDFSMAVGDYNRAVEKKNPEKAIVIDGTFCQDNDNRSFPKYLAKVIKEENYDIEKVIEKYIPKATANAYKKLIKVSIFCSNKHDKKILDEIHDNWFYGYFPVAMGTSLVDDENYLKAYKQLATLGSEEGFLNGCELSTGAEHLAEKIYGVALLNTQYDYMRKYYNKEREEYFDAIALGEESWVLIKNPGKNCMGELEIIVRQNRQLRKPTVVELNNKLMTVLLGMCDGKKMN